MPKNWTVTQTDECVLFAFPEHTRWDVSAAASFPILASRRLALQIRQDMWRQLQKVRGFSPAVQITEAEGGLLVKAGGQIDGTFPKAYIEERIADLLEDPINRDRWSRYAAYKGSRKQERHDA